MSSGEGGAGGEGGGSAGAGRGASRGAGEGTAFGRSGEKGTFGAAAGKGEGASQAGRGHRFRGETRGGTSERGSGRGAGHGKLEGQTGGKKDKGGEEKISSESAEKKPGSRRHGQKRSGEGKKEQGSRRHRQEQKSDHEHRSIERDGKKYDQSKGTLELGEKGANHRDPGAQREVSEGTGDHAGHRIGNRFKGAGGKENLAQQNSKINVGSYKRLENAWVRELKDGSKVKVEVTDVTRPGEKRPYARIVKWTVQRKDGTSSSKRLAFANTHTADSRAAQGIADKVSGQKDNVVQAAGRFRQGTVRSAQRQQAKEEKVVDINQAREKELQKVVGGRPGRAQRLHRPATQKPKEKEGGSKDKSKEKTTQGSKKPEDRGGDPTRD
jgi:DNA uptake protein ComE-like DNA-binding protein